MTLAKIAKDIRGAHFTAWGVEWVLSQPYSISEDELARYLTEQLGYKVNVEARNVRCLFVSPEKDPEGSMHLFWKHIKGLMKRHNVDVGENITHQLFDELDEIPPE